LQGVGQQHRADALALVAGGKGQASEQDYRQRESRQAATLGIRQALGDQASGAEAVVADDPSRLIDRNRFKEAIDPPADILAA